jgi:DNA-binding IclR family transcriptional regulator
LDLNAVAKPEINKLANEIGEIANIGVEENGQRVLIYKAEAPDAVYDHIPIGEFTFMHWSALGKAILAHLSEAKIKAIATESDLPKATSKTIQSLDELLNELEKIREQGYSVEDEERRQGIMAVAAPIIDSMDESVIGAVSVYGPKDRLTNLNVDTIVNEVRSTANVIELEYNDYRIGDSD